MLSRMSAGMLTVPVQLQDVIADLLDAARDAISVLWTHAVESAAPQIERALQHFESCSAFA